MELLDKLKKWFIFPLIGFLILFLVVVVNQTLDLYFSLARINPTFAIAVILLILLAVGYFIIYPLVSVLTYKVIPEMPKSIDSEEYTAYVEKMHELMKTNKFLQNKNFEFGEDKLDNLNRAFSLLDEESDRYVKEQATEAFLTTAISQNGDLDGIFMLRTLTKLIWRIVHMYEARPSLRKLIYIYSNVAATVLVARGIEDMDLIEDQVEPLVASLIGGSVLTIIPGAVPITSLVVSSVMEGSVNALLTLRCGCIAQRYMSSLVDPDRKALRRSASLEAVSKIGDIIKENTMPIVRAFANAAKNAAVNIAIPKFKKDKEAEFRYDY